ncbi:MAG: NAD(P)H-hydrate dehydratase [Candidatus Marsarchaeota archaeon]|nr:NAD(P)H-hydrate dehydratase [Candidatus Marsarchaeota archaeon]
MRVTAATDRDIAKATKARDVYGSKKDNGRVAVIAGSSEYHGAPALAANAAYNALAALRVGIGYVYLYVPASIINPVRALSPSTIVKAFGRRGIGGGSLAEIRAQLERVDAVVIGMGLGRGRPSLRMASKIIGFAVAGGKKAVVDADAIYAVRDAGRLNGGVVLTPQDREFEWLSGKSANRHPLKERIALASSLSERLGCCILLKGHDTVVTDGSSAKVIRSGSSSLATMGTGDVLSGIIGGYMAAGAGSFDAAVAGAYVHARIGDLLHRKMGNHILPSDVVDAIPTILKRFDIER